MPHKLVRQISVLLYVLLLPVIMFSCKKNDCECTDIENIYNTWEVVDFMSVESVLYAKENNFNPVIEFKKDGSYSLNLDANSCFGDFTLTGENEIEISGPGCTKICCDSDFSMKVALMLSQADSYDLEGNELKLNVPMWGWMNLRLQ